jgi:DDE superfamily endonuclease/Helix-turn-helix of DDE superfamily endonuclease
MLSYTRLSKQPSSFHNLSGISLAEFDDLFHRFVPIWEKNEVERLDRPDRKRAIGGGRNYELELHDLLLMTLIWLHLYLTVETLGIFFDVHKSSVSRGTRRVLKVLRQLGEDSLWFSEQPIASQRRNLEQALADFPDLLSILDVTETPIQRPHNAAQQKAHYSGKKKSFTRKTGLIVNEQGQIRGLTASYSGCMHDLTLFRTSGLLPSLPIQTVKVGDKGFEGLDKDLPDHSIAIPHKTHYKHPLEEAEKWANRDVAAQRIVVENTLCELKHFKVLVDRFRQGWSLLDDVFRAIVALINPRIARRALPL